MACSSRRSAFLVYLFAFLLVDVRGNLPAGPAASWPEPPPAVTRLVAEALERNAGLDGQAEALVASRERVVSVRSLQGPRADLVARYTVADGGRTIEIPAGDLVNPAYRALEGVLATVGQPRAFPIVDNTSIALLRPTEQETKLRLTQPLYRPELGEAVRASRSSLAAAEAEYAARRRELRQEVEVAVYRVLQAEAAVRILDQASERVAESVRVNRALFRQDKVTEDVPLRSEAEALSVRQQVLEAQRQRDLARSLVNYLRRRELADALDLPPADEWAAHVAAARAAAAGDLPELSAVERREELAALTAAIAARTAVEAGASARARPTVSAAVEAGTQGENYSLREGDRFVSASVVAEWNLFDGGRRRAEQREAAALRRAAERERLDTAQRLALELQQVRDEVRVAAASFDLALARVAAARAAFAIVTRREQLGQANPLAVLDARQELTAAELGAEVAGAGLLIAGARLDRVAALRPAP